MSFTPYQYGVVGFMASPLLSIISVSWNLDGVLMSH